LRMINLELRNSEIEPLRANSINRKGHRGEIEDD
jgi:hypothetical protein